ncbi:gustatory receptor 105 [Tribolium castaneum]|uniref:Gustatory receptor n=1 Tax=Tribolium castaneum TaxID=7070 RepID=A2AX98_TRICA|nr:gustatory receptor 105 [Tribolium castaneum]CAL23169.2 gustatory receptor candidate 36 [Tribolium castaneum]
MYFSRRDIRFLRPIFAVCRLFALVPYYNFEKFSLEHQLWQKIQAWTYLILLTTWTVISASTRIKSFKFLTIGVGITTDTIDRVFTVAIPFVGIANSCILNQDKWRLLNNNFQQIDKIFKTRDDRVKVYQAPVLQLFLYIFTYLSVTCYVTYAWSPIDHTESNIINDMCSLYYILQITLIVNYALALKNRFKELQKYLKIETSCRYVGTLYRILTTMMEMVNDIFGWTLILILAKCITSSLSSLYTCIAGYEFNANFTISYILFALFNTFGTILLIMTCSGVHSESQKLVGVCYEYQDRFSDESKKRRELLRLAQQVNANIAQITAANFFDISRSTFLGILATITTYFIVIIEFGF